MNYGELKSELVGLGFSDESELNEFGDIVPQALNRAITEINLTIAPIIGTYEFTQTGEESGLLYYDMEELTREDGDMVFLSFADTPVMINNGIGKQYGAYRRYNDFEIEQDKKLVMDGSVSGKFKAFYKKAHTPFTVDTDDLEDIPLPLKAHILVPLLTAYYVWLEDEKTKAVDYYNQYEKLSQSILNDKPVRMRILSGGL